MPPCGMAIRYRRIFRPDRACKLRACESARLPTRGTERFRVRVGSEVAEDVDTSSRRLDLEVVHEQIFCGCLPVDVRVRPASIAVDESQVFGQVFRELGTVAPLAVPGLFEIGLADQYRGQLVPVVLGVTDGGLKRDV